MLAKRLFNGIEKEIPGFGAKLKFNILGMIGISFVEGNKRDLCFKNLSRKKNIATIKKFAIFFIAILLFFSLFIFLKLSLAAHASASYRPSLKALRGDWVFTIFTNTIGPILNPLQSPINIS